MTRNEQLEFCKKCSNRKFDPKQGLICNLTGEIADFEGTCKNLSLDESVKEVIIEESILSGEDIVNELDSKSLEKLKNHQDFYFAFIGGTISTIIGAIIWALVTVAAQFQIGYMAIGIGFLVGFSVQFFGAGIEKKFGYLGAILSLAGCLLGNLFSQIGFIAQYQSLGYFETLTYLNLGLVLNIMFDSFSPIDLLFYGIAVYVGYKYAFRRVTEQEIKLLNSNNYEGNPSNYKIRKPLVMISIVLLGLFLFKLNQGVSGIKSFKYESGKKMSEGEMLNSKEHGKWTYWYENGNIQSIGFYSQGNPDSTWQWYDESGNLVRLGNYKNGLEHGVWMNHFNNGNIIDSGSYYESRMTGKWKYWFENGSLNQVGYYSRNLQDGNWTTFFENGQLNSEGDMVLGNYSGLWITYYQNGQRESEIDYLSDSKIYIKNMWDHNGNQFVKNGEGIFKSYSINGQILIQGKVENGLQVGKWQTFYENGEIKEEGIYKEQEYLIINKWDSNRKQTVKDYNGFFTNYYLGSENIFEKGEIINGLRAGKWDVYYETSGKLFQEQNYLNGKLTGHQKFYFESGELYSSGNMENGLREGKWNWYHESGNLSSSVNFKNDKKAGKQTMWSETGNKIKEEYYEEGELIKENIL